MSEDEEGRASEATPLRRALRAERDARESVAQARAEAREMLAQGQARARAIGRRADERIARVSQAARAATDRLLEEQRARERRALEALSDAPEDAAALAEAARTVARMLTRAPPDDASDERGGA